MIARPVAPQRHRTDRRSQSVVAAAARLHEVGVQPLIGADGSIGARADIGEGWLLTVIVQGHTSLPVLVCVGTSTAGHLKCHTTHVKTWCVTQVTAWCITSTHRWETLAARQSLQGGIDDEHP
jgi:hypothetical protein